MVGRQVAALCEMNPTPGVWLELSDRVAVTCAGVLELNLQETILLLHGDKKLSLGCRLLRGFDHFNG